MSRRNARDRRASNTGIVRARGASDPLAAYLATLTTVRAWWDPTSDAYFTFSSDAVISSWVSRQHNAGAKTLSQGVTLSQPVRALAAIGGKNTVQYDGVNDFLAAALAADWPLLHNNTGACIISIERHDSTGFAIQYPYSTCANAAANIGMFHASGTANRTMRIANGSGTFQNNWAPATAAHYARDTSRWHVWSYGSGVQSSHVSGSSITNADTGGQTPSVAAPQNPFTLGRSSGGASTSYKGHHGDIIILDAAPSTTVRNDITALLATKWGVAA